MFHGNDKYVYRIDNWCIRACFATILGVLYLTQRVIGEGSEKREDRMYLNISTDVDDLEKLSNLLSTHLSYVELKRIDKVAESMEVSFVIKANNIQELEQVKQSLTQLSPATSFSMVDQPDLVV